MEKAIDQLGFGLYQYALLGVATLVAGLSSVELSLLSVLVPCVTREFGVSPLEGSVVAIVVCLAQFAGQVPFGYAADFLGRRHTTMLASGVMLCGLAVAAAAPSFWVLCAGHGVIGLSLAGDMAPFVLLQEMLPTRLRGRVSVVVTGSWVVGSTFAYAAAYIVYRLISPSWRAVTAACGVLPLAAIAVTACVVEESPRWLLSRSRESEARRVVRVVARTNTVHPKEEEEAAAASSTPLIAPRTIESPFAYLATTRAFYLLNTIWCLFSFAYFGTTILVADRFNTNGQDDCGSYNFAALSIVAAAEISGYAYAFAFIDAPGRKFVGASGAGVAFAALLAFASTSSEGILIAALARSANGATAAAAWLVAPELLPTDVRGTGVAVATGFAGLGDALAAFLFWGIRIPASARIASIAIADIVSLVAFVLLPRETARVTLDDAIMI
ncbi:hypothetical protein CTAYLR_003843 [Chrysophaeum taylorii]|uniref:Major facilitator superfamily (MFS) profile domain-containing protein n=1 Tax=Chrysophaeum taylorii TaxID=2483200 RepID=A0AAD7XLY7_9STRA|nr:hypothetical protein CTAYLR_003843 [Chrysophaeum taylorii]